MISKNIFIETKKNYIILVTCDLYKQKERETFNNENTKKWLEDREYECKGVV